MAGLYQGQVLLHMVEESTSGYSEAVAQTFAMVVFAIFLYFFCCGKPSKKIFVDTMDVEHVD